jgi:putative ABC transport system permease protein
MMTPRRFPHLDLALKAVWRAGLRSLLAAGAVALGIASMTVMLALESGARRALESEAGRTGRDLLTITAGRMRALPGRGGGWVTSTRLDADDAEAISAAVDGVRGVAPMIEGARQVELEGARIMTSVRGVSPRYFSFRGLAVERGRIIDELDNAGAARVAVLGAFVSRRLGPDRIGDMIRIGGVPFEVVGELEPRGIDATGANEDNQILVPARTAARRLFNVDYLSAVLVQAEDLDRLEEIRRDVRELLRERHKLDEDAADDFDVLSAVRAEEAGRWQSAFVERLARVLTVTTLALGAVGVLIVTSLNVLDRTWEVGLRMAIGARRRDVAGLFALEACCLGALGGQFGTIAGAAAVAVLNRITAWPLEVRPEAIGLALLVSVLLGVLAGAAPAIRAARLEPVRALGLG